MCALTLRFKIKVQHHTIKINVVGPMSLCCNVWPIGRFSPQRRSTTEDAIQRIGVKCVYKPSNKRMRFEKGTNRTGDSPFDHPQRGRLKNGQSSVGQSRGTMSARVALLCPELHTRGSTNLSHIIHSVAITFCQDVNDIGAKAFHAFSPCFTIWEPLINPRIQGGRFIVQLYRLEKHTRH